MPLVSVVMPVHNSAATLGASVRSVLAQTHPDVELLVTDDASTDGSMDLLQDLARRDERVRPQAAPEQGGAARARNLALARARGSTWRSWTATTCGYPARWSGSSRSPPTAMLH